MALYFAYGSNMRSTRLRERVGRVQVVGAVQVHDFALRFDKPGRDGTGKANLVASPGERAWGVVYALSEEAFSVLDRFEPGYRRERFVLETVAAERLEAVGYRYLAEPRVIPAAGPHDERLRPADGYVEHLLAGAREHDLPASWIETIRMLAGPVPGR